MIFNLNEIETQITNIKFDKLFLRRHAKESFDELMAYDLFKVIMPAFADMDANQLDEVRKFVADFDQYINETYDSDLNEEELAYNRIEFIARLVICYMDVYQLTDSLRHNDCAFNLKVDKILAGFNLRKLDHLMESIKIRAFMRVNEHDLQRPNLTNCHYRH